MTPQQPCAQHKGILRPNGQNQGQAGEKSCDEGGHTLRMGELVLD